MKRIAAKLIAVGLLGTSLIACNTISIYDAWMSPDADGSRKRTVFLSDSDSINAIGMYSSGRKDATITVSVAPISLDPYFVDPDSKHTGDPGVIPQIIFEQVSSVGANQLLAVALEKGDPPVGSQYATDPLWIPGSYRVDFLVDGAKQKSTSFSVEFHDCPTNRPNPLTSCFPLYRKTADIVDYTGDTSNIGCDYSSALSLDPYNYVCSCQDMWQEDQRYPGCPIYNVQPNGTPVPALVTIWVCGGEADNPDYDRSQIATPGFVPVGGIQGASCPPAGT